MPTRQESKARRMRKTLGYIMDNLENIQTKTPPKLQPPPLENMRFGPKGGVFK